MSDSLPTIWAAKPHTIAKHRILASYLKAWMPILSRQYSASSRKPREVLFIDGFAGPGRYSGGEDGSPIIAIKEALTHSHSFPLPISFLFIEQDTARFSQLVQEIERLRPLISGSPNIRLLPPCNGDCDAELRQMLKRSRTNRESFGPALVFLDQFGYSSVAMDLIGAIMTNQSCEVFSYLFTAPIVSEA